MAIPTALMHPQSLITALAILLMLTPSAVALVNPLKRDLTTQTTFIYHNCNTTQTQALVNAHSDALEYAKAALESGWTSYYIDWQSEAALDYFGPPRESAANAAYIVDTFRRARNTYAGNPGDWWNDRYVDIYCGGLQCRGDSPAYNSYRKEHGGAYPELHFCPTFFGVLEDHDTLVKQIKADPTGRKKLNLRNLRGQATTVLHEWLHIKEGKAQVCTGGCLDHQMEFGGVSEDVYKAGRCKALAAFNATEAYRNNDNYAYFAMAKWMQKNLGIYPQFPTMWNVKYTRKVNEDFENIQPGAPTNVQAFELEDAKSEATMRLPSDMRMYDSKLYPEWYRPKLDQTTLSSGKLPDIKAPPSKAPVIGPTSGIDKVVCETSGGSPLIEDCAHAFGSLYPNLEVKAIRGRKGKDWWAGYVHSCAITVWYQEDWKDNCNATYADIQAHATHIFDECSNTSNGKVGGRIPFGNKDCPAQIQIMRTSGKAQFGE